MQDNARSYIARVVQQHRQEVGIPAIFWPVRSQDLNPIEYVWDIVETLRRLPSPPKTLDWLILMHNIYLGPIEKISLPS